MERYTYWMDKEGYDNIRRDIEGVFKNSKTGKIIKGDNFSCIVVDNSAEKSYRMAIKYYNDTRHEGDAKRIFVSAKWKARKLERLHKETKAHKYRIKRDKKHAKSYGEKLREFVMEFYEVLSEENTGKLSYYFHEALGVVWHFENGDEPLIEFYRDGVQMNKDIMLAAELIIGDIHKFIKNKDLSKLHLYYKASNKSKPTKNDETGRKSTLVLKKNGEYKTVRGWK